MGNKFLPQKYYIERGRRYFKRGQPSPEIHIFMGGERSSVSLDGLEVETLAARADEWENFFSRCAPEDIVHMPIVVTDAGQSVAHIDVKPKAHMKEFYDGYLTIYPGTRLVKIAGKAATLTMKEFQIFDVLTDQPGTILSKRNIFDLAWLYKVCADPEHAVDMHVSNLRRKVDTPRLAGRQMIKTVRGEGYYFDLDVLPQTS